MIYKSPCMKLMLVATDPKVVLCNFSPFHDIRILSDLLLDSCSQA